MLFMNIEMLRHPKEKFYRTLCLIFGAIIWTLLLLSTFLSILIFLIPIALVLWITGKFFQASVFGNGVNVNEHQYPEINQIVKESAQRLDLKVLPKTFIINAQGMTNALTVKYLTGRYVVLFSDLIDLLWEDDQQKNQIRFVIAHELAHHAAGHTNFWSNLLMKPAMFIPFLGAAYSRARELTCDRIAAALVQDQKACTNALISIVSGSRELITLTNKTAFINQEHQVPSGFGFFQEILSSHPRMTKRVIAIEAHTNSTLSLNPVEIA